MDGDEKKTLCGTFTKPQYVTFYNETVECGGALGGSVIVELQERSGCKGYIGIDEIKAYSYISKFDVDQFKLKSYYSLFLQWGFNYDYDPCLYKLSQVAVQGGTGITNYVHSVLLVHGVSVVLAVWRNALVSTVLQCFSFILSFSMWCNF